MESYKASPCPAGANSMPFNDELRLDTCPGNVQETILRLFLACILYDIQYLCHIVLHLVAHFDVELNQSSLLPSSVTFIQPF